MKIKLQDLIQQAHNELQKRYSDLSTCEVLPHSDLHIDRTLHGLAYLPVQIG